MISIVVVTYNSQRVIGECLSSLAKTGVEIIVVDNASSDGSVEAARAHGATVIANTENRGFAAACNQGAAAAQGDAILLLNPDTRLDRGLEFLTGLSVAAGVLIDPATNQPQRGFSFRRLPTLASLAFEVLGFNRLWPGNPVNRRYRCLDADPNVPQTIEQPAGACLIVPRAVWDALGGFDERFHPLWFEDVDFCFRLAQAGLKIHFEPRCRFFHDGGHSIESIAFRERQLYWYQNLFYYVSKNIGSAATHWMRWFVALGAGARIILAIVSGQFGQIRAYQAVIQLAWEQR